MNRLMVVGSLVLTALCVVTAMATSRGAAPPATVLAHDVYFTLKDSSPEAREALVEACRTYLNGHDGTVYFAAGQRAQERVRDVNDTDFDVSLHVYFESDAAHDAYQQAPRHLEFIEKMRSNWKAVRVFDSRVQTGS